MPVSPKFRVAAVNYLNAKPLLWGLERQPVAAQIEWHNNYPARVADDLREGRADIALMPVAAMKTIPDSYVVGQYGIAAHGNVVSVALFSNVPMDQIQTVYLDYQSRTSVRLAELLLRNYWKQDVELLPAPEDYISRISGTTAGVIIGDRALAQLSRFTHIYDLSRAWQAWQGVPFVFAAWIATRPLPEAFVQAFDEAQEQGLRDLEQVIAENPFPPYSLHTYYTENIVYRIGPDERIGMERFLALL
ncbi:MAG: hypothetical protein EOP52_10310 [Sphingobacteriales bacterium]|nr:MAG: hypothetical protein EOP52_10310 [Sphingobacteriales bacterium]